MLYERVFEGKKTHFLSKFKVNLVDNAVWGPGEGVMIRAKDHQESKNEKPSTKLALLQLFA
jgi:hypothetical protein